MIHVALAFYVLSFSLGLGALVLSFFAYIRVHAPVFRQLAATFGAGLLLLTVAMLKTYDAAATADFGVSVLIVYAVLSAAGCGLFVYMVPALAYEVCAIHPAAPAAVLRVAAGAAGVAFGVWREVVPGALSDAFVTTILVAIQAYGVAIVVPRLGGIANRDLRTLVSRLCVVAGIGCVGGIVQYAVTELVVSRSEARVFPIAYTLYFVLAVVVLLVFALRYPYTQRAADGVVAVPESFVREFGISPREREIVTLILSGYTNRMIADSLFISAMTVKNHIYHIYQKTGVENKIQLMNLIKASP